MLLRVLERIQRGEGRGKGCRCASPWVNVARLVRIRRQSQCVALICRAQLLPVLIRSAWGLVSFIP